MTRKSSGKGARSTATGREATLPAYDPREFPPFAVTVDLAIFTILDDDLQALLIERGQAPFAGQLALPGGFVHEEESLEEAAARELLEETGIQAAHLEQLAAYGDPRRDPRMRVVTVAFFAILPDLSEPRAGTDAARALWMPTNLALSRDLAFDHDRILRGALERVRSKLEYTSLATKFCDKTFTLGALRKIYEIVWDTELDPANFRRKVLATRDFVVPTRGKHTPGPEGGKPARMYRAGRAARLHPPLQHS